MSDRHLRPVDAGEKAPPATISEAINGSSRDVLASMRRALAEKLDSDGIAGNAIAAAYKELRELDRLIRVADSEMEAENAKRNAEDSRPSRSFNASAI